jgi:CubicO group peptidase (beta-lactamase class C family)
MKIITAFCFSIVFNCCLYAQKHKTNQGFLSQIPGWLQTNKVPAVGIALLQDGKLVYSNVFGELKKDTKAPLNTIFNVASLTKPITAMLALTLVKNGKWKLDEPLYHYWTDPDIKDDPRNKKLTTRIVLSHRTGFLNWRWNNGGTKLAFQFEPGTRYQYSGEGFEYLRKAVEKKFGASLEVLSQKYLFQPLKMIDTRFTWSAASEPRFAAWHNKEGEQAYETRKRYDISAADDLLCTVGDYGKFGEWVLNGAGLSKKLFGEMISAQVVVGDHIRYGLGWMIVNDLPGNEYALVHTGSDEGVRAAIILLPKTKRGLVIMTNGDGGQEVIKNIVTEALDCGKVIIDYLSR